MLSTFLLPSAPQKICCLSSVINDINRRQSTLSEELFDAAEEHALTVLLDAWNDAAANDLSIFRKVGPVNDSIKPYLILSILNCVGNEKNAVSQSNILSALIHLITYLIRWMGYLECMEN